MVSICPRRDLIVGEALNDRPSDKTIFAPSAASAIASPMPRRVQARDDCNLA